MKVNLIVEKADRCISNNNVMLIQCPNGEPSELNMKVNLMNKEDCKTESPFVENNILPILAPKPDLHSVHMSMGNKVNIIILKCTEQNTPTPFILLHVAKQL